MKSLMMAFAILFVGSAHASAAQPINPDSDRVAMQLVIYTDAMQKLKPSTNPSKVEVKAGSIVCFNVADIAMVSTAMSTSNQPSSLNTRLLEMTGSCFTVRQSLQGINVARSGQLRLVELAGGDFGVVSDSNLFRNLKAEPATVYLHLWTLVDSLTEIEEKPAN